METKEIWKPIKGFESLYEVSNLGRVKSLERKVRTTNNGTDCLKYIKERILKPKINRGGYKVVLLYNGGKRKYITIHRLVAMAFISNPNNYPQINHKDENKENNTVENLEWCDSKYNINYGTRIERISKARKGIKQPTHLVEKRYKKIHQYTLNGELVKVWDSVKEAQKVYNTHIADCARGERKTSCGYIWKYEN